MGSACGRRGACAAARVSEPGKSRAPAALRAPQSALRSSASSTGWRCRASAACWRWRSANWSSASAGSTRRSSSSCCRWRQVLPGPNIVNMALMIGDRFFGWRGAAAALAGLLLRAAGHRAGCWPRCTAQFAHQPMVAGALRGMGAVAAGLVIATALKLVGHAAQQRARLEARRRSSRCSRCWPSACCAGRWWAWCLAWAPWR